MSPASEGDEGDIIEFRELPLPSSWHRSKELYPKFATLEPSNGDKAASLLSALFGPPAPDPSRASSARSGSSGVKQNHIPKGWTRNSLASSLSPYMLSSTASSSHDMTTRRNANPLNTASISISLIIRYRRGPSLARHICAVVKITANRKITCTVYAATNQFLLPGSFGTRRMCMLLMNAMMRTADEKPPQTKFLELSESAAVAAR